MTAAPDTTKKHRTFSLTALIPIIVLILLPLSLTACAETSTRPPTSPPTTFTQNPTGQDPGRDDATWITLNRSGGFTGDFTTTAVTHNGKIVTRTNNDPAVETQLSPAELATFERTVATTRWPAEHDTTPTPNGADMYTYSLSHNGKTYIYDETQTPNGLKNLTTLIDAYSRRAVTKNPTPTLPSPVSSIATGPAANPA